MQDPEKNLHQKVNDWLSHEGYPLEFRVAHFFREAGFRVLQGFHVADEQSGKTREIDVVGLKSVEIENTTFYFVCLIECKWSKNKPWVLFSSSENDRGGSVLISQTIASSLGEAIVHILAADKELQKAKLFERLNTTSYGGRVAFTKDSDSDLFYSTVQSVISKSILIAKTDDPKEVRNSMPDFGSVVFPMIIVDGELFEASYNPQLDNVVLGKREEMRLRWDTHGSTDHAISMVSFEALETFIRSVVQTADAVLEKSKPIIRKMIECFEQAKEYPEIPETRRAYSGQPELLIKLDSLQRDRLE